LAYIKRKFEKCIWILSSGGREMKMIGQLTM